MKAESFETLTVEDMAVLLHKDVTSIRSDVLRNPRSLPPVLRLPGNRRLLWRRADVDVWFGRTRGRRTCRCLAVLGRLAATPSTRAAHQSGTDCAAGGCRPRECCTSTKRKISKRQETRDLILSRLLSSPEGQAVIAALLKSREIRPDTIDAVCPPGSLLDATVHALREWTDLRPEIGVAVVLALMSARMAQSRAVVSWGDSQQNIEMSLWMLILGFDLLRGMLVCGFGALDIK